MTYDIREKVTIGAMLVAAVLIIALGLERAVTGHFVKGIVLVLLGAVCLHSAKVVEKKYKED